MHIMWRLFFANRRKSQILIRRSKSAEQNGGVVWIFIIMPTFKTRPIQPIQLDKSLSDNDIHLLQTKILYHCIQRIQDIFMNKKGIGKFSGLIIIVNITFTVNCVHEMIRYDGTEIT